MRLWLVWPVVVLTIVAIAVGMSVITQHGFEELRIAHSRTNLIMLVATLVVPPAGVTLIWSRMRGRRRPET